MASTISNNRVTAVALESFPEEAQGTRETTASYRQILKSSAIVGGAQALNVVVGIGRTKAMAMFLGPSGFGLAGIYTSIVDLTQNLAGLGVNSSGVRQIAEAVGSNDSERIRITITVLRRTSVVLGVIGVLLLLVFAPQISMMTFGTGAHSSAVRLLSLAVFCKLVSGGQGALIQGSRRIADLAKSNVSGALLGALLGIALVYAYRETGIVLYVIAVAATMLVTSWWYSRKLHVQPPRLSSLRVARETAALLKLGVAFMASGLMTLGVAYAVRVALLQLIGLQATGYYQSAWTLGGLYVGFILQAMGADFYPRLTANASNHPICNRLVNQQARIGLLLAAPGVIATLSFAPAVIHLFYSAKFAGSVPILRWICLGTTLQVVTWPLGFVIVAKARQYLFLASEIAWAVVSVALAWISIRRFGVIGAGVGFFGSYIFHGLLTFIIARRLTAFHWSPETKQTLWILLSAIGVVFWGCYALSPFATAIIGIVATVVVALYCLSVLITLVGSEDLPGPVRNLAAVCSSLNRKLAAAL